MSTHAVLALLFVLLIVGVIPTWSYSRGWGYYPSGGLGLILATLFLLILSGRM